MKTPMQEHIEWLKEERGLYGYEKQAYFETAIEHAESMLEKEKDVMCGIYDDALARVDRNYLGGEGVEYFNEHFKTKER